MEQTSNAYRWGFLVGVIAGVILVAVLIRAVLGRRGKSGREYDERQQQALGKAYKYGYYTLLIYLCMAALFDLMTGIRWCSMYTNAFIGVLLSVGVFGVVGIINDAYFPFRQSPKRYIILFAALGVMNLGIGVMEYLDKGTFVVDGMLSHTIVNPLAGVLLLALACAMVIKALSERNGQETERYE